MPGSWKIMFTIAFISASSVHLDSARAASTLQLSNPDGGEVRALVIGIDDYQHVRKLKGATADAHDIDSSLRTMGDSIRRDFPPEAVDDLHFVFSSTVKPL